MKIFLWILLAFTISFCRQKSTIDYELYPQVNEKKPDLASPFIDENQQEYVVAVTRENKYAIIRVTLGNDRDICKQLIVDSFDFPTLAATGLHSEKELQNTKEITGRSIEEITKSGRPGGLSQGGFMAKDETILSVLKADNQIVRHLGLTHPQLAKPLFHLLNMMDSDLKLNRWNMAKHRWENVKYFFYNGQKVYVEVEDTKGGQLSIFDDGIQGGFFIKVWRDLSKSELDFLKEKYSYLSAADFEIFIKKLSHFNSGEIQPQYIMRYGFYEGHTFWRTDPITLSFIFGLKSLADLQITFKGNLYSKLTSHFTN